LPVIFRTKRVLLIVLLIVHHRSM